jgi:hypothetical protein
VTPLVPKPLTSGAKADGRFGKQDFVYDAGEDVYRCPVGEKLTWRYSNVEAGRKLHNYWTTKCAACALKPKCTPAKERRVKRWEHEAVLDAMQERLDRAPGSMRVRRQTAEHPFGTIKAWMGATHFRLRTLEKVRTEMSLHVLAYNLKRMIAILGCSRSSEPRSGGVACASPSSSCARSPPSERTSTTNIRPRPRRRRGHPSLAFPANPCPDPSGVSALKSACGAAK